MITRQGDTLIAKGMNRPPVMIIAISDVQFYVKDNVGEFTFYKDERRGDALYSKSERKRNEGNESGVIFMQPCPPQIG